MLDLQSMQVASSACLSILYLGAQSGTALQRADALRRLGHKVTQVSPRDFLPGGRAMDSWLTHTGAWAVDRLVRRRLLAVTGDVRFDVVWADGGQLVNPRLVADLKARSGKVINYMVDDPFGGRDGLKFRNYLRSVSKYDLLAVLRECNVDEAWKAGARDVIRVLFSADEIAHAPSEIIPQDLEQWGSEVAFIGTWMPERGPFLSRLVKLGVPLAIYGYNWHKSKEWSILRAHWRGPAVNAPSDYRKAVQCAKVCLGLLSKGNRDLSTTRSFEIPYLGGVFCAERTSEHLALYREDEEAVFWDDADECAVKCKLLLNDEQWRHRLGRQARARCLQNGTMNGAILEKILRRALPELSATRSETTNRERNAFQ